MPRCVVGAFVILNYIGKSDNFLLVRIGAGNDNAVLFGSVFLQSRRILQRVDVFNGNAVGKGGIFIDKFFNSVINGSFVVLPAPFGPKRP